MRRATLALWTAAPCLAAAALACAANAGGANREIAQAPVIVTAEEEAEPPAVPVEDAAALFRARLAEYKTEEARLWPELRRPVLRKADLRTARPPRAAVPRGRTDAECLAQAVYYEARSESAEGQAAVARVVLNRRASGLYPRTVCGVVFQGAQARGCQFSFACDGSMRRPARDSGSWERARTIAAAELARAPEPDAELAPALNYHADYVKPRWAAALGRVAAIGRHIFYRPGGSRPPGALSDPPAPPADALRAED